MPFISRDRLHSPSASGRLQEVSIGGKIELILFFILGAGVYVGWNIGANDTANCIGPTVGCGLLSYRNAVILVALFVVLGGVLQGHQVMKTIGKGIVKTELNYTAIMVALICPGFFVTIATFFRIPTSTSQAIVGGVTGIGLALGAEINYSKLIIIAESWVICPFLAMALSFILSHLVRFVLRRISIGTILVQNALGWLAIISGCYVAFSLGANHAGIAVGPISNLGIMHPMILLLIGGIAIAVGAITYGKKVTDTVGKGITPLDIPGAFVAQISSAFGIHLFSIFGIPVSTSSAIVGAIVGVGLTKGAKAISKKTIWTILIGWVLTPCLAAGSSFILYKLISNAIQ
ncbi:MAG: anion permease, partial [Desulfobulbaceae bacterium]|nr:anion permease [Desulfobulbaceae bacterium]